MTLLRLSCLYQNGSIPKVVESLKYFGAQIPYFTSKIQNQFYDYSLGLILTHLFRPLSLCQKHDQDPSNGIHPLAF